MDNMQMTEKEWHRSQAVACFNKTWDYIDKIDRTKQDNYNMIHTAHASRYHWGYAGAELQWARGEWQISRVYSLLSMGQSALFHAKECLKLSEENHLGAFDVAFAYEAMARAYKALDSQEWLIYKDKALDVAGKIESEEDKNYTISEINNI